MLFSVTGLDQLGEGINDVENIFLYWQSIHHPDRFKEDFRKQIEQIVGVQNFEEIRGLDKHELYSGYLRNRADLRARGLA